MNQLMKTDVQMTSLNIAELTGKRHADVMRDIRKEVEELGEEIAQRIFALGSYLDKNKQERPCYKFGKDGAMQLALKYDAVTRYKVIKHIEELEQDKKLPVNSTVALLETALKHEMELAEIKTDVDYLKGSMRIDSLQQQEIQQAAKQSIVQALGGKDSVAYKEISKKVFSAFWNEFKHYFKIPRYGDIPKVKHEEALRFISLWRPSTSLQMEIDSCNSQMAFE
ncbi:phage regulatory protein [Lysinibacillus mangiferihumi]|uniref:Phage regulatory protein n=1 Tax=Lysinibacillus mangiferihumi TaxID=1130819 RepID=A0A4U2XY60_9BACI|nr:Rha family transcriptional regulator [Lysinibacillus mangiferihumi]TKI52848.1 phage regulatory protein [Lysinibacillus mangiferihumi]